MQQLGDDVHVYFGDETMFNNKRKRWRSIANK